MTHIQWSLNYDTGIEVIDLQHRKIIAMLNELNDSSSTRQTTLIRDNLQHMREYVADHFSFEEELMQAAGYPYLHTHSQLHQRFMERLEGISHRRADGEVIDAELSSFLGTWLTHHFGYEDKDYINDVARIVKDVCI